MKHKIYLIILIKILFATNTHGQQQQADSIFHLVNSTKKANKKAEYLNILGNFYRYNNTDSAYKYITKAKELAHQHKLPTQLAEAYNELGILWYNKQNIDSAYYYLNKGYNTAKKIKDFRGQVKSLNSIGIYKTREKKYDEAFGALNEALSYSNKINDISLTSMLYNSLALLHKANSNMDLALEFYHKALKASEEDNDLKAIGKICSNMGLLFEAQDKTELALKYLNRSLSIREKQENKLGESYVRTNLGLVYENLREYEKALKQYRLSLSIKKDMDLVKGEMILYNNIAIIFKKQALYDSAYFYCNKALGLRIQLKDKLGEARTRTVIGQVHLFKNKFSDAQEELNKALNLASKYKNYSVLQNIYSSLYQLSSSQKDYEDAVFYLLKSNAFKDSIFNIQKERSIANIEAKYNSVKKEKENLQLIQDNKLKDGKLKQQIIIGTGLILIIILFFLLFLFTNKSRKNLSIKNKEIEQQSVQLMEAINKLKQLSEFKEAMTNMLVHDLKTPLNLIINIKELKEIPSIEDMVQQSGYDMLNLVNNILDVYKYQNAALELNKNTISLRYILVKAIEEVAFLAKTKHLKINIENAPDFLIEVDEEIIKRVFVNLISNAIKFTPNNESISITSKLETPERIRIGIANPGTGIPIENQELIFEYFKQAERKELNNIKSSGLGLAFCKLAIEAHKGNIGIISETQSGVEFWFTLPKTSIKQNKTIA